MGGDEVEEGGFSGDQFFQVPVTGIYAVSVTGILQESSTVRINLNSDAGFFTMIDVNKKGPYSKLRNFKLSKGEQIYLGAGVGSGAIADVTFCVSLIAKGDDVVES